MSTKIVNLAKLAKEDGYIWIASVVKSVYNTTYYHIVFIDDIIREGRWIPAPKGQWSTVDGKNTWNGRLGHHSLPPNTILRQALYKKYGKV